MDVRDRRVKLEAGRRFHILFFERGALAVRIHSIRIDDQGNIVDAPEGYRRFFMEETQRSLKL